MRIFAVIGLALLCSGCFAFEEIDKGYAIMEAHTPAANKKKQEEEKRVAAAGKSAPDPQPSWWENARTLGPREQGGSDPLVSCRVAGGVRFMRRSACLSTGGTVAP